MRARQTSAPEITRSRSRALILLLVASAMLLALGIFLLIRMLSDDVKSGGPLALPEGSGAAVATPVDLNAPYSWGLIHLRNEGDDAAHVEGLDLGQIPSGLRVLGSYAVPGNAGIGFGEGYRVTVARSSASQSHRR